VTETQPEPQQPQNGSENRAMPADASKVDQPIDDESLDKKMKRAKLN
jgi:hypothetical protein